MGNVANIKIGTNKITYNGVDLGYTKGGDTFNFEEEVVDITVNDFGNSIIDQVVVGQKISVKVMLTELQISNMKVAIPSGLVGGATSGRLSLGRGAGYRRSTNANQVVLRPLNMVASNDPSDDIVIHKAVSSEPLELEMSFDDQMVYEVTFTGYIDTTKSEGNYLGFIGDSTD